MKRSDWHKMTYSCAIWLNKIGLLSDKRLLRIRINYIASRFDERFGNEND